MWRILKSWLVSSVGSSVASGTVADLDAYIQKLLNAPSGSSLIIEVSELADRFLQFTAGPDAIQIDHPLITAEQIQREQALRRILEAAGLTPYETRGSDGSRFLDCDMPPHETEAAILVRGLPQSLFGVDSSSELRFFGNGFALPA
jgi:hypothetical protein